MIVGPHEITESGTLLHAMNYSAFAEDPERVWRWETPFVRSPPSAH
jgi:hypothetical protein